MKIRTHISKALSLLTSAAIAVGCISALELPGCRGKLGYQPGIAVKKPENIR